MWYLLTKSKPFVGTVWTGGADVAPLVAAETAAAAVDVEGDVATESRGCC